MGFLKNLFRRKKTSKEQPSAVSSKKNVVIRARKAKNKVSHKDTGLLRDVDTANVVAASTRADNAIIARQGSFSNTNITSRDSNSSKEAELLKEAYYSKSQHSRILSPRNNLPDELSPADKMKFQVVVPTNENFDHSNTASAVSPRLSHQQLQQFERQQSTSRSPPHAAPPGRHQPMYAMSAELPKGQLNAMDDMDRSESSASSFNLSTDAEDSEYEMLRNRGVLPGMGASTLDTSTLSAVSTPTAYTTDDDRIFPALQTDDDMTQASAPSIQEPPVIKPTSMLAPLVTPDDEPGRIQIYPMNNESEDDFRAWGISPSTASKDPASAKSNSSNQIFNFQQRDSRNETSITPRTAAAVNPPTSTKSRNTPGAQRNFTSPKSQTSSNTDFSSEFGNFADFSNFPSSNNFRTPTGSQRWNDEKSDLKPSPRGRDPKPSPRAHDFGKDFDNFNMIPTNPAPTPTSVSASQQDSSLSELLAQAKNKRRSGRSNRTSRASSSSVNSAPAITASYLRQHHNLRSYNNESQSRTSNNESTSVSDIIHSLEATNQTRMKNTGSKSAYAHRSVGDTGAVSTVRAVKERLREKRRTERDSNNLHKSRSSEASSSENSDNEASESWLFDEVTGALGPRGIAADLESLSGRSNRSKSSQGNKSHKSHKSRSRRSRGGTSSRRHKSSSNESVDSRGSRQSRNSRYSHRSTKSFLSQMSEQSRSVANDLLRLEMQLAMVGSQENRDDVPVRANSSVSGASIGGASRTSRTSRKSLTSHRTHPSSIARRSKATVVAPPGKLGIILANKADSKGTVVSGVRTSSVLVEKISPGDRIIAIDGEDVSRMTVSEITTIMSRKADYERTLTVLATPKHNLSVSASESTGMITQRSPSKSSADQFDNSFQQYRR
jgi:hypothetical protein